MEIGVPSGCILASRKSKQIAPTTQTRGPSALVLLVCLVATIVARLHTNTLALVLISRYAIDNFKQP